MVAPPMSYCELPKEQQRVGAFISQKFVIQGLPDKLYQPPVTNITLIFPLIQPGEVFVPLGQHKLSIGNYSLTDLTIQSRTASYQRRYKNGTSSALV